MKLAYISGKYTDPRGPAFVNDHIQAARQIAVSMWALGIPALCPHLNTQHFEGVAPYETFLLGDLLMVERSDLLVMVPNWRNSKGAVRERDHAIKHKVPAYEWPADLGLMLDFVFPSEKELEAVLAASENLLSEDIYARAHRHLEFRLACQAVDVGEISRTAG